MDSAAPEGDVKKRFRGSLLGVACGDALGGLFEAQDPEWLARRFSGPEEPVLRPPVSQLWYTDDTQMTLSVAETLAEHGKIVESYLCQRFCEHYMPNRGYGRGARRVLEAMCQGEDYRRVAERIFPGGSYGNGAAMRVAPVGLVFRHDLPRLWAEAAASARPTHVHPLGIQGAQLLALAVAWCATAKTWNPDDLFARLLEAATEPEYRQRLQQAAQVRSVDELPQLGNGIAALESVITAIACFALSYSSYTLCIGRAILLGGDTDTIAAMAGGLSGAYLGEQAIPVSLLDRLEDLPDSPVGRSYIAALADRLAAGS